MRYYFNTNQYSIIKDQSAVHRIRTCKPFTANDFQDRSLTTRTYGKYSGRSETATLKLFLHYIVQFHADFLPLTARFTPVVS